MEYDVLNAKLASYIANRAGVPASLVEQWQEAFAVDFTRDSTALEGNSMTREETRLALELLRGDATPQDYAEVARFIKARRREKAET